MSTSLPSSTESASSGADWLATVSERANNLRYGSVLITIHDGRVTQIDTVEKIRILPARSVTQQANPSPD
jgi:hypothetical protein